MHECYIFGHKTVCKAGWTIILHLAIIMYSPSMCIVSVAVSLALVLYDIAFKTPNKCILSSSLFVLNCHHLHVHIIYW